MKPYREPCFEIKIQACIDGRIVASKTLSALRKDVTAKLYGGDVTRKMKLREKQKKGKQKREPVDESWSRTTPS